MGKLRPASSMRPTKCFFAAHQVPFLRPAKCLFCGGPPSAFFAARQKLLGSKNNFVYDIVLFVYDILIDIVLSVTVSHYVTSFSKCMCFSSSFYCLILQNITSIAAYIPLCVLRNIWQHTMRP